MPVRIGLAHQAQGFSIGTHGNATGCFRIRAMNTGSHSLRDLNVFRARYAPPEMPRFIGRPDESVPLRAMHGIRLLERAPANGVIFSQPPRGRSQPTVRYLWVIDDLGIPYILEQSLQALRGAFPKHTNLTGGKPAYLGGRTLVF